MSPAPRRAEDPPLHLAENDDNCDIALLPAATLLLPYFQVDLQNPAGQTTLFTITNVSPNDQIARVTLWTDGAYPALTFNVFLTGYDVQSINLYDVLARGVIAPDGGTGSRVRPRGELSHRNTALDLSACRQLPGALPAETLDALQRAFTLGTIPNGCTRAGLVHEDAIGYATIDVVRSCSDNGPSDAAYWTADLRHDNVLTGDYQQVHPAQNFGQGSPLVHIRAVSAPLPRTFYDRYQSAATPHHDGRQPLPATFAARWIQGGPADFQTSFKIWREGASGLTSCSALTANTKVFYVESVIFDEHENAVADASTCRVLCIDNPASTATTGLHSVADYRTFPHLPNGAISGWMYLNLDNDARDAYASSNWVGTSMRSQGRYSVDLDAAALGNGCSRPIGRTEIARSGGGVLGPAPNVP
jgi:hypothetical protein